MRFTGVINELQQSRARRQAPGARQRAASGLRGAAKGFWASAVIHEPGCVGCHELILPTRDKVKDRESSPAHPSSAGERRMCMGVGWGEGTREDVVTGRRGCGKRFLC